MWVALRPHLGKRREGLVQRLVLRGGVRLRHLLERVLRGRVSAGWGAKQSLSSIVKEISVVAS